MVKRHTTRALDGFPSGINNNMFYSLYLHIPFCRHRCHYCDFNTYVGQDSLIPPYLEALDAELRFVSDGIKDQAVHTIYFGGGTPSLISIKHYETLLKTIRDHYHLTDNCEISLEANPGTLSRRYLADLRQIGFNRLSLGVQSTDSFDLARLDRIHSIGDILDSFADARWAGFDNISLDLIYGLPWQNLKSWEDSLTRAIMLRPDHFSVYSLIIEPGTPLYSWYQKGLIAAQDQDLEADMYESTMALLDQAGYEHYEISNWSLRSATKDFRCRHNLQYWRNYPYLGLGAGAHGYVNGVRTVNVATIPGYIHRFKRDPSGNLLFPLSPATISSQLVGESTAMKDFMMLGLRLLEFGVCEDDFMSRYGRSMLGEFGKEIEGLIAQGLISFSDQNSRCIRLTRRGRMVANHVFMAFV